MERGIKLIILKPKNYIGIQQCLREMT